MSRTGGPKQAIKKKTEIEDAAHRAVYSSSGDVSVAGPARAESPPRNVYLVGLRGSGKSTLGRLAAEGLDRPFADTDDLVEERAGKSIADIVAESGWGAFRDLETQALREVSQRTDLVVATGGGIVLRSENRDLLAETGHVFYLMAGLGTLKNRLTQDPDPSKRPPLADGDLLDELRTALAEREPLYMQVVNFVLTADKPLEELLDDMREKLALV